MTLRIGITGSSGLIGSEFVASLREAGHAITRIVRSPHTGDRKDDIVVWNPMTRTIAPAELEDHDVIIHLAGENLASGRWTLHQKGRIRDSRILGTRFLSDTLASLRHPPQVLLSASAVEYYGHSLNGAAFDEAFGPGTGFLPDLCRAWEEATEPAEAAGIRVVHLRFGLVLHPRGGALGRMLPFFRLGLGGKLGSGRQMLSWIALEEIPHIVIHLIGRPELHGPVNVVSPYSVSNAEFTRTLGRVLRRPAITPGAALAARVLYGSELVNHVLLAGTLAVPRRLLRSGYRFRFPDLEAALRRVVDRTR